MVGFVIVSHSETLAKGVVELTKMMADDVPIQAAGGLDDGSFGTSFEKISNAIEEVYSDDGVIVLMDMGSAVMTTEMVLELMPERKIVMADCPLVEGAVAATVSAMVGRSLDEIMNELSDVREQKKVSAGRRDALAETPAEETAQGIPCACNQATPVSWARLL